MELVRFCGRKPTKPLSICIRLTELNELRSSLAGLKVLDRLPPKPMYQYFKYVFKPSCAKLLRQLWYSHFQNNRPFQFL